MTDKNLFLKNYSFYGKHCKMVNSLTDKIDENSGASYFNKTIDLFIISSLVGVKNNHKEKPSVDKSMQTNILAEQFNSHNHEVSLAFKIVTLLGNSLEYNEIERLNKTFRYPDNDENYIQFEEYMLGGLEDIYNALIIDSNKNYDDYLISLNSFLNNFKVSEEGNSDLEPDAENLFD